MNNKFQYDISIEASSTKEAEEKMNALITLVTKLTAQELIKLAHIVKNDPIKTAMAKRYLM